MNFISDQSVNDLLILISFYCFLLGEKKEEKKKRSNVYIIKKTIRCVVIIHNIITSHSIGEL